jgi:hypothetical protein
MLPPEIRAEVERRMLAKRFSGYEDLARWARQEGYDISNDSLWRYGKSLKQEFAAIEFAVRQARMLADEAPDRKEQMTQALIQVLQHKLLAAMAETEALDLTEMIRLAHGVAEVARLSLLAATLDR